MPEPATEQLSVQANFFKSLKAAMPPHVSVAEELATLLGVSNDSAYRRLRGETSLTIDEAFKIASKYSLSIDSIFARSTESVTCDYICLTDSADNFEKYLDGIYKQVLAINSFKEKKIIYAAEEVPIFHSLCTEKLRAFKLFYWQKSVLNVPDLQGKDFSFDIIPQNLMNIAEGIYKNYLSIPSIEIWTHETILTQVKQVEFYFESGVIPSKEMALEILNEIRTMGTKLRTYAEQGSKIDDSGNNDFQLYCSDLLIGTNCIHIHTDNVNYSYITFNSLNSLNTRNNRFCSEIEHWMKNLIRKSNLISGSAEKQRFQFFKKMNRHFDQTEEIIKNQD